jgi:hypothetical protein
MGTIFNEALTFYFAAKTRALITTCITSLFILLFIYTATSKILAFQEFSNTLYTVPLIGQFRVAVSALVIAALLISGILLIIPFTQRSGLYSALLLIIIFNCYLVYMVSFAVVMPCTCGGITEFMSWKGHIWVNTLLILLASLGILTNQSYKKQQL